MQEQGKYSRASITEAIIDLKTTFFNEVSLETLASIYTHVKDRFPFQEIINTGSVVIEVGTTNIVNTSQQTGFIYRTEDRTRAFQATLNGFTFNRLPPYTSWEEFRDEAKQLWEIYTEICKTNAVVRAGIRFINRLELPGSNLNLKNYLRTVPELAPGLPQVQLSNFFMQLQVPQDECMLIINETTVPSGDPEVVSIILDFDLFREQTWQSNANEIWELLEKFRVLKNIAFETSITDETRRLIA